MVSWPDTREKVARVERQRGKLEALPATSAEEPSTRGAQALVASWLIHTREAHRQGQSARGSTSRAALHAKPPGKSFAQEAPAQELFGQDRKASKHFTTTEKGKVETLLNLTAVLCPGEQEWSQKNHFQVKGEATS